MGSAAENRRNGLRRVILFSALMLLGIVVGGLLGGGPEPLAAVPHCEQSECEHNHRWWWWDSDECVPNSGQQTVCGPPTSSDHDCSTRSCSDYHAPHGGGGGEPCDDPNTPAIEECN